MPRVDNEAQHDLSRGSQGEQAFSSPGTGPGDCLRYTDLDALLDSQRGLFDTVAGYRQLHRRSRMNNYMEVLRGFVAP